MNFTLRTPYGYYLDKMEDITFDNEREDILTERSNLSKRSTLLHFMVWSHIVIAVSLLAIPFFTITGQEAVLAAPFLPAGLAFISHGRYVGSLKE
ncbi:MAG: hypothetical protein U9R75_02600 [Candidatus Thermoplasmatota archaeon]|nr:hypothetical protein [Candidatus Thermoplasmatota archaeon]